MHFNTETILNYYKVQKFNAVDKFSAVINFFLSNDGNRTESITSEQNFFSFGVTAHHNVGTVPYLSTSRYAVAPALRMRIDGLPSLEDVGRGRLTRQMTDLSERGRTDSITSVAVAADS